MPRRAGATGRAGGAAVRRGSRCELVGSAARRAAGPWWTPAAAAVAAATEGSRHGGRRGPARRTRPSPPRPRAPRAPPCVLPSGPAAQLLAAVGVAGRPVAGLLRTRHQARPGRSVSLDLVGDLPPLGGALRVHQPLGVPPDALAPALDQLHASDVVERVPASVRREEERVVAPGDRGDHALVGRVESFVESVVVDLPR